MNSPLVTVGLVVFNGAAYLREAIQSILDQTFRDYELVIYDNASTDDTALIASEFAARDPRIRIVRHASNIGALRNWIAAVDDAQTPYFCWAAHEDLREQQFLERLVNLFEQYPEAELACCDTRIIDPSGERQHVAPNTRRIRTTTGMKPAQRTVMYLQDAPESPIFGLYRTECLKAEVQVFRDAADRGGPLMLWLDIVFLAGFVSRHGLAIAHEPLFLFRRGGTSHRIDHYQTLREFLGCLRQLWRLLPTAVANPRNRIADRLQVQFAALRYLLRTTFSSPVRRMGWHHLSASFPIMKKIAGRWTSMRHPAFRNLSRRARALPVSSRVVIFGAGKHTRRCIEAIRAAIAPHAMIVGICDDAAPQCSPIGAVRPFSPDELVEMRPDILLISTDTYESAMCRRAFEIAPPTCDVWCIYDPTLELSTSDSSSSTERRKSAMTSISS